MSGCPCCHVEASEKVGTSLGGELAMPRGKTWKHLNQLRGWMSEGLGFLSHADRKAKAIAVSPEGRRGILQQWSGGQGRRPLGQTFSVEQDGVVSGEENWLEI